MRRMAVMAAILLLGAGAAPAARLCRDSKGLFTPCTGERPPAEHRRRLIDGAQAAPVTGGRMPHEAHASTSSKPPLVAKAKLCRDSKGLFTPCAR